jgi:hypothetical protein
VLSEGDLPPLQLRDVFQRSCRVGTWAQTYDRRAGTWTPGNYIVPVAAKTAWNCPYYCGTSGKYTDLTTLSYENTHADADDTWDKQVHCFVREGIQVTRILDSTYGPSNNVIDLALYLIRQSSRFPESLLDLTAMEAAATFTAYNNLYYNGEFKDSGNLEDWLQSISSSFLLRVSDSNGKKGLRPRLPTNANGSISTAVVSWVFGFTEDHIMPDGFNIEYISLSERKPICAQVIWRQQPENDIGLIRTTEVRFIGTAIDGPYEQYDLSQFCATEDHAVKVGAYYVARRKYVTHTLRLKVRPDAFNDTLSLGDIVRVQLRRETTVNGTTLHDYLYEVERINRSLSGSVELDLVHFPIDTLGRSMVALYVKSAIGNGYSLPTGREDFSCDIAGRDDDETPLPDEGGNLPNLPTDDDFEYVVGDPDYGGDGGIPNDVYFPGTIDGGIDNPVDPYVEPVSTVPITGASGAAGQPLSGDDLNGVPPCPGGKVCWYRRPKNGGERTLVRCDDLGAGWQAGSTLSLTTDDIDYIIEAEASCPDPGQPGGFGTPIPLGSTLPVQPDTSIYAYARWVGTISQPSGTTNQTSPWINYSNFLTVGPAWGCFADVVIASNELTTCPPVGPIPWRASVQSTNKGTNPTGLYGLGGLGVNGNNSSPCSGSAYAAASWGGTVEGRVISISGRWEYSNDQSTVLFSWGGDTEYSEGT